MVVSTALQNKEKTIPDKIIVEVDIYLSTMEANLTIISTVKSPHKNPVKGNVSFPNKGNEKLDIISKPTPSEAPEDTPKVYGEANGFLSTDWTTAPLTDNEPPTIKANNTLGNLKFQIIAISLAFIFLDKGIPKDL